jgi:hypothetical protein
LLDGKNEGFVEGYAVGHRDGEYLTLTKLAQELIDRAKDPRFSQDPAALRIQGEPTMSEPRATQLDVLEFGRLNDWGRLVSEAFRGEVPYLVGSALSRKDYRDVDVRLMLDDSAYDRLASVVDIKRVESEFSRWGKQWTDLRIDFQVQRASEANRDFNGRRNALGLRESEKTQP